MLFRETEAVYCENRMEHTDTLRAECGMGFEGLIKRGKCITNHPYWNYQRKTRLCLKAQYFHIRWPNEKYWVKYCHAWRCDLQDGFWTGLLNLLTPYSHTTRDYRQYSAMAILHTLQFIVAHELDFSVFTSRILATDLQQSHCHFRSHMKSSLLNLILFLPIFCNWQSRRLDSIPFLCSEAHILAGRRLETRLFNSLDVAEHFFITTLQEPYRKHSIYC
jgi:hypothetical protein